MEKKRVLLVLVLAAIIAGGAFAEMSAGGGILYSGDFTSGMTASVSGISGELKMPSNAFGVYGFFDANYVEVSVGLLFGTTKISMEISGYGSTDMYDFQTTTLSLGLLGKYPIPIGKIVLFPAVGIDYNYVLSAEDGSASYADAEKLSTLWIRFGAGLDFDITENLYLRGTVLFGIKIPSEFENDLSDAYKAMGYNPEINIGFGTAIKFAVGYKF